MRLDSEKEKKKREKTDIWAGSAIPEAS